MLKELALRTHLAKLLVGNPKRWATETKLSPSPMRGATDSCFCWSVNRRLGLGGLGGLVIVRQSEGHGMTPANLSTKPGQPQVDAIGEIAIVAHALIDLPRMAKDTAPQWQAG